MARMTGKFFLFFFLLSFSCSAEEINFAYCEAALLKALEGISALEAVDATQALKAAKSKALKRIRKSHPQIVDLEILESKMPPDIDGYNRVLHIRPRDQRGDLGLEIGHLKYFIDSRGIGHSKIFILNEKYRRKGLFEYARQELITRNSYMKGILEQLRDVNATVFFNSLFSGLRQGSSNQLLKSLGIIWENLSSFSRKDVDQVKKLRSLIFNTYREGTPAGIVTSRLKFKQVRQIFINYDNGDVRILSIRDKPRPLENVQISIGSISGAMSERYVLLPDGSLKYEKIMREHEWLE